MREAIPLVDLRWQHRCIRDEVMPRLSEVMQIGAFIMGDDVAEFEASFAEYSGVRHCVGCASGTDALELALRAAGVGRGDEVVVPANTFMASAAAVLRAGATPRLVDCDDEHQLIDPVAVERALNARTRAVLPVHLFGQMAPMEDILDIAEPRGVPVIEDAAQSQGASRHGRPAGSRGLAAGVSFYPGKNLGAYGDAGCVLTDDGDLAGRVRLLHNHGSPTKYEHTEVGFNSRLDTLQAVVLRAKLKRLESWNQLRRQAAARYDELLHDVPGVRLPRTADGNVHVWHLYVVRLPHRDETLQRLHAEGIGAGVHYPVPLHLQPALHELGHARGDFPVAEAAAAEMLSLPIYPGITVDQQERVAAVVRCALS